MIPFDKYYDVTFDTSDGAHIGKVLHEILEWAMDHKCVDTAAAKNDELCDVVFARLDTHIIIATLRYTFIIRTYLECWDDKVDEAERIIMTRGLDPVKILRGLKRF